MKEATGKEIEVKFYVRDLKVLETRLVSAGGELVEPRLTEVNLRFDLPGDDLLHSGRLLRLRQDKIARLTYKGPGGEQAGARLREELEFEVSDFKIAQSFLEALGYQVVVVYEKYRTTYTLGSCEIVLDELPYGYFIEIEGPDGEEIRSIAERLEMDWEKRILDSYLVLFERLKGALSLDFRDLSFANFKGISLTAEALGVAEADTG